jgi:LysM repeat protein
VRLTARGRRVVAALVVSAGAAVLCLFSLTAAGGAAAASHGAARAGYQGMRQVVVEPGQTLWSVASAAEPQADPQAVIQQIMQANSLAGTTIRAGQVLWVPRG